jgi:hypothetical protein
MNNIFKYISSKNEEKLIEYIQQNKENILVLLQDIINLEGDDYNKFIFNKIYEIPIFKKELKSNLISEKIERFFTKQIRKKPVILKDIFEKIKNNNYVLEELKIIALFLNSITSFFVDIYTLLKIFSNFQVEPNECYNIIIYAGNLHSGTIAEFLIEELEFDLIENTDIDYTNCVDMSSIKQPLFNLSLN